MPPARRQMTVCFSALLLSLLAVSPAAAQPPDDPTRVQPGYTLFAPMLGDGTVCLVDMDGAVAHTWRQPYRPGLYGYLLDNGHLFYGGKVMEDLARFEAWPRFKGGAVLEVDWH